MHSVCWVEACCVEPVSLNCFFECIFVDFGRFFFNCQHFRPGPLKCKIFVVFFFDFGRFVMIFGICRGSGAPKSTIFKAREPQDQRFSTIFKVLRAPGAPRRPPEAGTFDFSRFFEPRMPSEVPKHPRRLSPCTNMCNRDIYIYMYILP